MTVQELLDEVNENPGIDFEIDRYIFSLFNRMLNERGFQCNITSLGEETLRCRIVKKNSSD